MEGRVKIMKQNVYRTYIRTAIMLLCKAVADVTDLETSWSCTVDYTIGDAYFIRTRKDVSFDTTILEKIKQRMLELVEAKAAIVSKAFSLEEARAMFSDMLMEEKAKLFRYRRSDGINLNCLEGYYDYFYGPCFPDVSIVDTFDILEAKGGFFYLLPAKDTIHELPNYEQLPLLIQTLEASHEWYEKLGITTIGDLNDRICGGDIQDMILVQESHQEGEISDIAKEISSREHVKFVMIAGPSSSGKTTFSHRLSIHLKTLGKKPHPIALDNYFVNRTNTPLDKDGNPDFECLESVDVKKFNEDMTELLAGKEVDMPQYNFKTGKREYVGNKLKLDKDDILVIEGIHGLNDKLSYSLPNESKFKIYISALTSLNIDEHNRIPSTDNRLLRRIVRDARTRGQTAANTIDMWQSVRRGEEKYIFPFQEKADVMFNSVLIYELAVMKQYAEPLLFQIKEDEPAYEEAKRLLKFLDYFLGVSSEAVPLNSICREFVGGSCFHC